jgi:hypothetical protein
MVKVSEYKEHQEKICRDKFDYFWHLDVYFMVFQELIFRENKGLRRGLRLFTKTLSNISLPIPEELIKKGEDLVRLCESKGIECDDKEVIEEIEKGIDDFAETDPSQIRKLKVNDLRDFYEVGGCLSSMYELYDLIIFRRSFTNLSYMSRVDALGISIIEKTYELIGYWTAKIDMAKSSKPGSKKKKDNRDARLRIIQKLWKKYPLCNESRSQRSSFYADVLKEADLLSTRTVDNYLKALNLK